MISQGNACILFSLILAISSAPAQNPPPACVPEINKFYWKSPCDEQSFTNQVIVSNLTATQQGKLVDELGGLDASIDLDIVSAVADKYGVIKDPKVDISIAKYIKTSGGQCAWSKVPTFGLFNNLDGCKIIKNCHLNDDPQTLNAALNIKSIAGFLYFGIDVNKYYGLSLIVKDGKNPIFCVYAQDIIIKK